MPPIDAGNLITLALAAIGGLVAFVTMRTNVAGMVRQIGAHEEELRETKEKLEQFRLHVSEAYVRHNDLEKVEKRLVERINDVKDTILAALKSDRPSPPGGQQ
jgi:hypothetical protein